jgi:type IV pilus assembly protein PilV
MMPNRPLPRRHQGGIALLEALLATLVLAIGLLGTIGMQARAYSALSDASTRAEATLATEQLLGLMASDQANVRIGNYSKTAAAAPSATLAPWYNATRASIPGALIDIAVTPVAGTPRSEVSIRIRWTRKAGGPENTHQVTAYVST